MKFVPFAKTSNDSMVLGCIHQTRTRDYHAFMVSQECSYSMEGSDADHWKTIVYNGWPVGRGKHGSEADLSTSTHPVVCVNFFDAQAFCEWLTHHERAQAVIGPKDHYRLPTDAEWSLMVGLGDEKGSTPAEKSANGPKNVYPWGSEYPPRSKVGNYADETAKAAGTLHNNPFARGEKVINCYTDGFATTAPVMSFPTNKLGFYDLGGNVWEWCGEWCSGDKGRREERVLRGASWGIGDASFLLSSFRITMPFYRDYYFGFRCVLVLGG